jgi:hypothetical protein
MIAEPKTFLRQYKLDYRPNESIQEHEYQRDIKGLPKGTAYRDAIAKLFLWFPDIYRAMECYDNQADPKSWHSLVEKDDPVKLSVELDIDMDLLNNTKFTADDIKEMKYLKMNVNRAKSLYCRADVERQIIDMLEKLYGLTNAKQYIMYEAEDNREDVKYSYRIYMNIAFKTKKEYKYFVEILKEKVKKTVSPMIDPTKSMLRVPGSWKIEDDGTMHQLQWTTPGANLKNSTLTYVEDCVMLKEIAPAKTAVKYHNTEENGKQFIGRAVDLINEHPLTKDIFEYMGNNDGLLKLRRYKGVSADCDICKRTHTTIDAYATIYRGEVRLRCFRDEKLSKKSILLGYIGEPENVDTTFKSLKTLSKELEKKHKDLELANMSNAEQKQMADNSKKQFDELKARAKEADELLAQKDKFYFSDYLDFHEKLFSDYTQFNRYVKQTIAKIINGGNSLFITGERLYTKGSHYLKDEETYTRKFTELNCLPCSKPTEAYELSIINPSFDITQPIDKNNSMIITKRFCDVINKYTMRNFYKTVDFIPYLIPPAKENMNVFNMFEGFRFPYQEQKDVPETVKPWINHILEVVCSGNKEQAKILTQWMAHIIQKPTEKAFCVILYGGQGSGKSILYELFTQCIGRNYCLQVGKLEDLTQTHNPHVIGKLLVNCNECTNEPTTRDVNIMKGLITEIEMLCNPKNVNPYTISVYSRFLITSNYKRCMRLDKDDRRYFCLETLNHRQNDDAYFKPLIDSIHNDQTQRDFFDYLANYDISDFKCQRPPISKMKRELIGSSVDNVVLFIKDVCENNVNGIPFPANQEGNKIFSPIIELYAKYDMWVKENDSKGRKSSRESLRDPLEQYLKIKETKRGARGNQKKGFEINRIELLPHFRDAFANPKFDYAISNPVIEFEADVVVADEE